MPWYRRRSGSHSASHSASRVSWHSKNSPALNCSTATRSSGGGASSHARCPVAINSDTGARPDALPPWLARPRPYAHLTHLLLPAAVPARYSTRFYLGLGHVGTADASAVDYPAGEAPGGV